MPGVEERFAIRPLMPPDKPWERNTSLWVEGRDSSQLLSFAVYY